MRRQLQWLGHVARMGPQRLSRKFLVSRCNRARPQARPEFTYGAGLRATLAYAELDEVTWMDEAQERGTWKEMIKKLADKMESGPLDDLDKGAYRWLVKR